MDTVKPLLAILFIAVVFTVSIPAQQQSQPPPLSRENLAISDQQMIAVLQALLDQKEQEIQSLRAQLDALRSAQLRKLMPHPGCTGMDFVTRQWQCPPQLVAVPLEKPEAPK
jgi:hypothetical protein